MKLTLVGASDLTVRLADCVAALDDIELVGCVGGRQEFSISYAPGGVRNVRFADLEGWSTEHGIPFHTFDGNDGFREFATTQQADLALVAGWYHLIPRSVRELFPRGVLGVHASLLPKLRGGAPLVWAILSGQTEAGVSLFELGEGVDEGDLYAQRSFPISSTTTITELVEQSAEAALEVVAATLPAMARGEAEGRPQQGEPSYCLHRRPADGRIDWAQPAIEIDRLVRAVTHPYPGAFTALEGDPVFVWAARPATGAPTVYAVPGGIARLPGFDNPLVSTGDGLLEIVAATDGDGNDIMDTLRKSAYKQFENPGGQA